MIELWKDIKGYEGYYRVSNLGRVRGLDRLDGAGHRIKGQIIKGVIGQEGRYEQVGLCKNGIKKRLYVHRLVAQAFCYNPHNKSVVNHIDENKKNNKASNLEWVTIKDNNIHGTRLERVIEPQKHPIIGIHKDTGLILEFGYMNETKKYKFSPGNIHGCITGRHKTHKGFKWYKI